MDANLIVEQLREREFRDWKATINDENVIRLTTKYRPAPLVDRVEGVLEGSFNSCFKVAFSDGIRWMIRVPKPGRSMHMEEKVRGEVAVMKYIKSNTSIPVPDIIAFGTAEDNVGGFGPFMITEFMIGENLGDKLFSSDVDEGFEETIYRQISGFLLQLSNCTFDAIGSLSMETRGEKPVWSVTTRPLTLATNELLRGTGLDLYNRSKPFTSTLEYFLEIVRQKQEHLLQQPNSVDDRHDAIKKLRRRQLFRSITPRFVTGTSDRGPFPLVCDDFRPGNMLVRDGRIVAVLDWEWTYAAPIELLASPPWWLCKGWPAAWDPDQQGQYPMKFERFLRILREEEGNTAQGAVLSTFMEESWRSSGFNYYQLLLEVFLFDEDWLWKPFDKETPQTDPEEGESLVATRLEENFFRYLEMTSPIRVLQFLCGTEGSTRCSFCWACGRSDWMGHAISDCPQTPSGYPTNSVQEAVESCSTSFRWEGVDVHSTCATPYYYGCTDQHCMYNMVAFAVYVGATSNGSHLHRKARREFANHFNIDMDTISREELMVVMGRPYKASWGSIPALIWFVEQIHDDQPERSFQWYSAYS